MVGSLLDSDLGGIGPKGSSRKLPLDLDAKGDLLRGADAIADFVYGDPALRRRIYHLAERKQLPVFRLGAVLCARRSVLLRWIAAQESEAGAAGDRTSA